MADGVRSPTAAYWLSCRKPELADWTGSETTARYIPPEARPRHGERRRCVSSSSLGAEDRSRPSPAR